MKETLCGGATPGKALAVPDLLLTVHATGRLRRQLPFVDAMRQRDGTRRLESVKGELPAEVEVRDAPRRTGRGPVPGLRKFKAGDRQNDCDQT